MGITSSNETHYIIILLYLKLIGYIVIWRPLQRRKLLQGMEIALQWTKLSF